MKQKLVTIVITLIAILAPLIMVPTSVFKDVYLLKAIPLLIGGLLLLILTLVNYKKLKVDEKDVVILIFFALVFTSMCLCYEKKIAIMGETIRYEGMLMFATYICIYIASKKLFEYKNINVFLNIMFYVSLIAGMLGIAQNYLDFPKLFPLFHKGICSTFGNSNFFGSFISIILPISIIGFIYKKDLKCFLLSNILFFDMLASGTRSTWVAFVFVAIIGFVYLIVKKDKTYWKNTGILLLCFILITVYLFSGISQSKAKSKFNGILNDIKMFSDEGFSDKLGSGRMEIWKMTLKLIEKKPLFGCGPDNLRMGLINNCYNEFTIFLVTHNGIVDKAHNEYMQIAATIGVPALIVYMFFLYLILASKIKLIFKDKICFIFILAIISYLVQAFFNISTVGIAPLFWMLLGFADNEYIKNSLEKNL